MTHIRKVISFCIALLTISGVVMAQNVPHPRPKPPRPRPAPPVYYDLIFKGALTPYGADTQAYYTQYTIQLERSYWEYPAQKLTILERVVCQDFRIPCPRGNAPSLLKVTQAYQDACGAVRYIAEVPNRGYYPHIRYAVITDNYYYRCQQDPRNPLPELQGEFHKAEGGMDYTAGSTYWRKR